MEGILPSIKTTLGITVDYSVFDADLILYINSVLAELTTKGVGKEGFYITGDTETWSDFIGDNEYVCLALAKPYVAIKVQLLFDPPSNSSVIQAKNDIAAKYEWLMYSWADDELH